MEPNDNQLSSYFHHQHHHQQLQQQQQQQQSAAATSGVAATPTNGLLGSADGSHHMVFPHTVPSAVSSQPVEPAKRKRGRPRKYGTPEQALAAKKAGTTAASSSQPFSPSSQRDSKKSIHHHNSFGGGASPTSSSYKKSHSVGLGNAGQGFTPHVISVAAGEDISQKIMLFMQQSKRELCILSASGSISNASLRQPATSGGNITYEGRFEIISLTGSFVRTNEFGGRSGGLSICLSSTDGQIIGGGVGGPLKAAGPVQVIVGTFFLDTKKDTVAGLKGDASANKLSSPVGESPSGLGFRQPVDSSGNPMQRNDEHQAMGGSHFMIQQLGLHVTPPHSTDWGGRPDSRNAGYDMTGRSGHGAHESPENGGFDIAD